MIKRERHQENIAPVQRNRRRGLNLPYGYRIQIGVIALLLFISPVSPLFAEDYPAGYLGPGYREYLEGKVIPYGYFVEYFQGVDELQKARVDNKNMVQGILSRSYQATPQSEQGILIMQYQAQQNAQELNTQILIQRQLRQQFASVNGQFTYIPYSDGKKVYFQDGLPKTILNERVVDELGNVNYKNTQNMQYNDKRLLVSYEADITDQLGNVTRISWYGAKYTGDSVYYGGKDTNANKNITEYYIKETDPSGKTKVTHVFASTYTGKLLKAFSQTIEDSIYGNTSFTRTNIQYAGNDPERPTDYHEEGVGADGLLYSLDRSGTTYNEKGQITGYHEEAYITQLDGTRTKTTTDAQFTYLSVPHQFGPDVEIPDQDRLLASIFNVTMENADGAKKTEATTTTYQYNGLQLVSVSGHSDFTGQESRWYEYTDAAGHILAKDTDQNGNTTYSYIDTETLITIIIPESRVTSTLKDGNKYAGSADTQYEIPYGRPMIKQVNSQVSYYGENISPLELLRIENTSVAYNNSLEIYPLDNNISLRRLQVLSSQEHTQITSPLIDPNSSHAQVRDLTTGYFYDTKGNYSDARGSGTGSGWEYSNTRGWYGQYNSTITEEYSVILGRPVKTDYFEDKNYLQ